MKYKVNPSNKFQKDVKRLEKRGYDIDLMKDIIKKLADGKKLPRKYKDHALKGKYKNCRECHVAPDWVLIYEVYKNELILYLTRTGKHEDVF